MPSGARDRQRAMWDRIREAHDKWDTFEPYQRENWLTRIADGMGITRVMARARIEGDPCPHCDSLDVDRGATGLDLCNACGGFSRDGKELR